MVENILSLFYLKVVIDMDEVIQGAYPCKLGARFFCLLDEIGPQHVLGTFGVDVAVSSVQALSLVQPLVCLHHIPCML